MIASGITLIGFLSANDSGNRGRAEGQPLPNGLSSPPVHPLVTRRFTFTLSGKSVIEYSESNSVRASERSALCRQEWLSKASIRTTETINPPGRHGAIQAQSVVGSKSPPRTVNTIIARSISQPPNPLTEQNSPATDTPTNARSGADESVVVIPKIASTVQPPTKSAPSRITFALGVTTA